MSAAELFDDAAMAAGYAHDRPPVHPHLTDRLRSWSAWPGRVATAVDVGCGAGASTAALLPLTDVAFGVDPSVPMVQAARRVVPGARFAVAGAEVLPCATGRIDLLAAAGALNFADLDRFVREADRVLTDRGVVAVSDYAFGRPTGAGATDFVTRFSARWLRRPAARVDASSFAATPLRVVADEHFTVTLPMTRRAYLAYVMTDTAVARAIGAGTPTDEIRAWCAGALLDFGADQPVAFDATLLVLTR